MWRELFEDMKRPATFRLRALFCACMILPYMPGIYIPGIWGPVCALAFMRTRLCFL